MSINTYLHNNSVAARLDHDILLTYSSPAVLRTRDFVVDDDKDTYLESGTLSIWRWLGIDRFFPPGYDDEPPRQGALRGCASVSILFWFNLLESPLTLENPRIIKRVVCLFLNSITPTTCINLRLHLHSFIQVHIHLIFTKCTNTVHHP